MQQLPTLEDWAWVEIMLIQSMVGSISKNFRKITLSFAAGDWVLGVTLAQESEKDREEISEIVDMFGGFIMDVFDRISNQANARMRKKIFITTEPLDFEQDPYHRIIFQLKE